MMSSLLEGSNVTRSGQTSEQFSVRPTRVTPWVCRPSIAPRVWRDEEHSELATESNGSEGCYGGWEIVFPISGSSDRELLFQITANATNLARGSDEVVVDGFWRNADGIDVNWDPILVDDVSPSADREASATGTEPSSKRIRFTSRLRHPADATSLAVRFGLRWSPRGSVRWSSWSLSLIAPGGPRTLRLGIAAGRPPRWTNWQANAAHYVDQCRKAGEAGIDLVCLPETILSWGSNDRDPISLHAQAVPLDAPWIEPFREVARQYRIGIGFSVYERAGSNGEIVYNSALLLGRDGELIGTYRKVHLAIAEVHAGITPGHDFPIHRFEGIGVGMLICMDSAAAESFRVMAQRGAEIVLLPIMGDFRATSWEHGNVEFRQDRWDLLQRSHAFDNHLYVVAARNTTNGSTIVSPWGEILAYNHGDRDLIWADVNVDDRRAHPTGPALQSVLWSMRRPSTYGSLADPSSAVGPLALRHPTS